MIDDDYRDRPGNRCKHGTLIGYQCFSLDQELSNLKAEAHGSFNRGLEAVLEKLEHLEYKLNRTANKVNEALNERRKSNNRNSTGSP